MSEKPTYEELEQRVQEFEKTEFELKRAEKELLESEDRYRAVHLIPGIIDPDADFAETAT